MFFFPRKFSLFLLKCHLKMKAALQVQIFKKSLVLSKAAAGNIVNLVSTDCQKVADACTNLQYLWSAVIEIIGKILFEIINKVFNKINKTNFNYH